MSNDILPYVRNGSWSAQHPFYCQCAYFNLKKYEEHYSTLTKLEETLKTELKHIADPERDDLIYVKTYQIRQMCHESAVSMHLFLCMTIEAFVNHYGVRRLGEAFYKQNLERVGITEKIALIIATCFQKTIPKDNLIILKSRALFDKRNQFVHPKSKEINQNNLMNLANLHPKDFPVYRFLNDFEEIIEEFYKLDPTILKEIEFKKTFKNLDE